MRVVNKIEGSICVADVFRQDIDESIIFGYYSGRLFVVDRQLNMVSIITGVIYGKFTEKSCYDMLRDEETEIFYFKKWEDVQQVTKCMSDLLKRH